MFQVQDEGPKLWLNELRVTKALANKEYFLKNFEKGKRRIINIQSVYD